MGIGTGTLLPASEIDRIQHDLRHEGYAHLGQVLDADEVELLRDTVLRKAADPQILADEAGDHIRGISLMRMFEYDNCFRDLIVREPFAQLAETILGDDCHVMAQNALIYGAGQGGGWHVDDALQFPLPDGVDGHSADEPPPCLVMQIFTPLTDMDPQAGCTQVVPGSHLAGKSPDPGETPEFRGCRPVSIEARAGEVYLFNNQIWHQGSPNHSTSPRILGGVTYARRFIAQRFYPFIDYRMPEHVWDGASPRLQRFLGRHGKGAYG